MIKLISNSILISIFIIITSCGNPFSKAKEVDLRKIPVNGQERAKQNVEPTLSKARKQNIGSAKRIWSAQEIGRLSDKDFRKQEADIDQAYRDGRVKA